jgi:hypothetical protein
MLQLAKSLGFRLRTSEGEVEEVALDLQPGRFATTG